VGRGIAGALTLLVGLGPFVGCSSGNAQACHAEEYPMRSVVLDARMVPGFKQYNQQHGPIDLNDDDDTGARVRLFSQLGVDPGNNVVSAMAEGDGAPNHGSSITSIVIQAPSAKAARSLVDDGALLVLDAAGSFFGGVPATSKHTTVNGQYAVALRASGGTRYESDALMWAQGTRAFSLSIEAPRTTNPARHAQQLAEQQQLLSTCA
jgi:hypothetical protein